MAIVLVVETGRVVAGANTFVTLAEANAYHEARGNAAWTGTEDEKAVALVRAGQYLNGLAWKGARTARANAMAWPRGGVMDAEGQEWAADEIPQAVRDAQCEAALREIEARGSLQPNLARGGQVKRKKTDVLETEYFESATPRDRFTAITDMLWGLLSCASSRELVRS
ncbi:hypothetical protein GGQ74_001141 [Desulfobaculum xiamenense]|uniref:Putative DnaT-like domain-containing protein n=1 Tax=Desulfobaculum xiamenense TaxID=995050 RepID=A0A846QGZ8_9BACT|nr:DnaT-like ssDNA-binding protein [Desulfobaculum xiamenense]NJB67501.1 hypothetical protein [Desulfobaculum xiamenense]